MHEFLEFLHVIGNLVEWGERIHEHFLDEIQLFVLSVLEVPHDSVHAARHTCHLVQLLLDVRVKGDGVFVLCSLMGNIFLA